MTDKNLVQITLENDSDREVAMVRVDKNLKELMEEKPFGRWDVNYLNPKWHLVIEQLKNSLVETKYLFEYFTNDNWLISTDHVRASKGEKEGKEYPVEYYSPAGMLFTGYDMRILPHCTDNAYQRMRRAHPTKNDLLLGGFGMGPTGKSLVLWHKPSEHSIVGNIFILRTEEKYNPFVLDVFFKSKYGQAQFNKFKTGVAFNSLSNDEIKYLVVPSFGADIVDNILEEYKGIASIHDSAMDIKDSELSNEKLKEANHSLMSLIHRVESIIEGREWKNNE